MKVQYCEKCDKWQGKNKECSICGTETLSIDAPSRRNSLYYIDGVKIPLVSVTTILSALAKPQLIYWAAITASGLALENPLITAKDAAAGIYKVRDNKGNIGSDIHHMIEKDDYGDVEKLPDRVKGYIVAYEKWKGSMSHDTIFNEKSVFSLKYKYAGTLDRIIKTKDGKIWLIDFKTSKDLYPETGLQLSAYKQSVIEMGLVKNIDCIAGLLLKPDGTFKLVEYKDDLNTFIALQSVYNWSKNIKK